MQGFAQQGLALEKQGRDEVKGAVDWQEEHGAFVYANEGVWNTVVVMRVECFAANDITVNQVTALLSEEEPDRP